MINKKDLYSGIAFLFVAVGYFAATYTIRISNAFAVTILSSASIPRILAVILFLLGIIQVWVATRQNKRPEIPISDADGVRDAKQGVDIQNEMQNAEKNVESSQYDAHKILFTVLLLIVYLFSMEILGFTISSLIYIFAQILLMTDKNQWRKTLVPAGIISVLSALIMYYLFNEILGVLLPTGLFGI